MRVVSTYLGYAIAIILLQCSCAHAPMAHADMRAADTAKPRPYPFWNAATLGQPGATTRTRLADGAALPVAPGYFLVPMMAMGPAALDFTEDPAVIISDGVRDHRGAFVGINTDIRLGLVRMESFAPAPYALARDADPKTVYGLRAVGTGEGTYAFSPMRTEVCVAAPSFDDDGNVSSVQIGCRTSGESLMGLACVDDEGALVALLAPYRGDLQDGVDASRIRKFLDTYFASWGRYIDPRPSY